MGFVAHRRVILPMLLRGKKMPDGSFFDTMWRIFLRLLAQWRG